MRPARAILPINAGSDLSFLMVWAGADDQPLDLTGLTIEPFDVHPALAGHLSLSIPDPAAGEVSGRIEWSDDMPLGRAMSFRARVSGAVDRLSTPQIILEVK